MPNLASNKTTKLVEIPVFHHFMILKWQNRLNATPLYSSILIHQFNLLLLKKYIFATFIIMASLVWLPNVVNAQSVELDLKIGVPLPVGDTFLSQYDGVFSSEATISYPIENNISAFIGLEYQRLNFVLTDVDLNIISRKVGLKKKFIIDDRIIVAPDISIGYSRFNFNLNSDIEDDFSLIGVSVGLGITPKFEITDNWNAGVSVRYNATFMESNEGVQDTAFNKQYHVISPGIITTFNF